MYHGATMTDHQSESQRLAELERYQILDSPPEVTFDRVVAITLAVFDVDFALITFVDRERCWYKAELGLGVSEMPRSDNMCDVVIRQDDVYVVPDAQAAPPEDVQPLLKLGFRFYAGAPVRAATGVKIGTVCAVGKHPREVTDAERRILAALADIVSEDLELRLAGQRMAEAEDALRSLNEQLQAASQNKSEFLASMSHELRAPLNGILGASEMLSQGIFGDLTAKQREYVHDIHQSGQHLLSLINDVLDLSRIEAGQVELQRETLGVSEFMEACASMVRGMAMTQSLHFAMSPPAEAATIDADERRLKQAACNLLSNAVKFSPEGGRVTFSAWREQGDVVFLVDDEGPGIPEEHRERIFEQFFRLPGDHEGTGLGLPVARQLVELHKGRIWFESKPGRGSQFYFSVPAAQADGNPPPSGGAANR